MKIAVVNQSTKVTDDQAVLMVRAVQHQVTNDLLKSWPMAPPTIWFYRSKPTPGFPSVPVPGDWWQVVLLDNSDQAGALGYHALTPQGQPYGRVFAEPVLTAGGDLFTGGTIGISVASVLSHEVMETLVDPPASLWGQDNSGLLWAYEVGDPVESFSYTVTVDGSQVDVSDFVTPAFFDASSPTGTQFDKLGQLSAPFTIGKGGYAIQQTGGQISEKFGADYPDWRKDTKSHPASRTSRRTDPTLNRKVDDAAGFSGQDGGTK